MKKRKTGESETAAKAIGKREERQSAWMERLADSANQQTAAPNKEGLSPLSNIHLQEHVTHARTQNHQQKNTEE